MMKKRHVTAFSVKEICLAYGLSRQAYYQHRKRKEKQLLFENKVLELVKAQRALQPRLGSRKLYYLLSDSFESLGIKIGRDKLFSILREAGLLIKRKPKYVVTTNSNHPFKRYDNKIKDLKIKERNQVWVSDITYLRTKQGFLYLALLTDLYSRKILGWDLSDSLSIEGSLRTLNRAMDKSKQKDKKDKRFQEDKNKNNKATRTIHHSDRGIQYCSYAYTGLLKQNNIEISMSAVANPYENAVAERLNGILKQEYQLKHKFNSRQEALKAVKEAVYLYNNKRPHNSLNYLTPTQMYESEGAKNNKDVGG